MSRDLVQRYGPWAVVAGAVEGIGRAFCEQLAARGLNLLAIDCQAEALEALADDLHARHAVEVRVAALDLADDDLLARLEPGLAGIEVGLLVYNAARSGVGAFLDRPLADHLEALAVNCRGPLCLAHRLGRPMRARGRGGMILMASLAGLQGTPLVAAYGATKAFDQILAESLWDELRAHGVDVLACAPGPTRTPGYLATAPRRSALAPRELEPSAVAAAALAALGREPLAVPGAGNRLAAALLGRVLPRRLAVAAMGRAMRTMYADRGQGEQR